MEAKMYRRLKAVMARQSYSGQTKEFRKWIVSWIRQNIPEATIKIHKGNIYITKGGGDSLPCIVAHIDTVHRINRDVEIYESETKLFAFDTKKVEQYGIGGDDKVGVWIALEMLLKEDNIKIALFRDEETGCEGSGVADMDFFDDCGFCLQADRRGYGDFVDDISGELSSQDFKDAVYPILETYGYKFTTGMITDVGELKSKGLGISVANISCAYYHPHTNREYVDLYQLNFVWMMIDDIVKKLKGSTFNHVKPVRKFNSSYSGWNQRFNHLPDIYFDDDINKRPETSEMWLTGYTWCVKRKIYVRKDIHDRNIGLEFNPKSGTYYLPQQLKEAINQLNSFDDDDEEFKRCPKCDSMLVKDGADLLFCFNCNEYL
jgi:tripeptide aminopeptidase